MSIDVLEDVTLNTVQRDEDVVSAPFTNDDLSRTDHPTE